MISCRPSSIWTMARSTFPPRGSLTLGKCMRHGAFGPPLDGMAPSKFTSFFKPDQSPRTRDNVASPKNLAALSTHNKGKFAIENGRGRPGVRKLYKRSPENNRNLSHDGALSRQACTHGGLESEGQRRTSEEAGTQDDRSVMHLGRRSALEAILPACCNFWMTAGQPKKPTLHVAHPPSVRPGADGAPKFEMLIILLPCTKFR